MTGLPLDAYRGSAGPQAATFQGSGADNVWFTNWLSGNPGGLAGPVVNEQTALNYLTVYSCVSLIAGTISALPLVTYRKSGTAGRSRATDLRAYAVLHDEYNPDTSAPVGRETQTGHLLTWGNSYEQVIRNKSGTQVLALQNLPPDLTTPYRSKTGDLRYEVKDRSTGEVAADLPGADVIHVPALGFDGVLGYSPVRMARAAIRAGMAQDNEAERFITRGIRPPGAVKFPAGKKFPTEQAAMRWRDTFKRIHSTEDSSLNVVVLEDGADWVSIGLDPESAQLLESRKLSSKQVCGLYRVPPHLIGEVDAATSWGTGIAEQVDGFIKFALLPWVNKAEKERTRKMFGPSGDVYCKHLMEALERADILKRTQAITQQILHGYLMPNEAREIEDRNPAPGMDFFLYPLNMGRVDDDGNDIPPPTPTPAPGAPAKPMPADDPEEPDETPDDTELRSPTELPAVWPVCRAWLAATCRRLLTREANALTAMAEKPATFLKRAGAFYDGHLKTAEAELAEVTAAWVGPGCPGLPLTLAEDHVKRSKDDVLALCATNPPDLAAAVKELTDSWLVSRPAEVSRADV